MPPHKKTRLKGNIEALKDPDFEVRLKAIGNLGWNDIKLTAPVFVGDTIYAESEVLSKRESASRPGQGLVTVRTIGRKADGTPFMSFERTVLVPKRGHGVED